MSRVRVELSPEEGQALGELVLSASEGESRLLVMLRDGRLVQALRTDTGPVFTLPPLMHVPHPRVLRSFDVAKGVDRVVTVELDRAGGELLERSWEGILEGTMRADPPWVPFVELLHRASPLVRAPLGWLIADGAYALLVESEEEDELPVICCARVQAGRVRRLIGARGLDLGDPDPSCDELLRALRSRVGRSRLLVSGTRKALTRVLASAQPATEIERAVICGDIALPRISSRLSVGLFVARLLGL